MSDPLAVARTFYAARFATGLALLVAGALGWPSRLAAVMLDLKQVPLADAIVGTVGFWMALSNTGKLVRVSTMHAKAQEELRRERRDRFARDSLPRQVFALLLSVAEADGVPGKAEREIVRRFLLERFVDPITYHDLRTWEAQHMPAGEVRAMARAIAIELSPAERDTIFFWSCLVAFADGRFRNIEHEVLQDVAVGLGLPGPHARRIFHHARARAVSGTDPGADYEPPGGDRRDRQQVSRERARAFRILGLEPGAPMEQVRARHRELVKQHHPDAHSHLGPVAAREATVRFREIQQAYELLSS